VANKKRISTKKFRATYKPGDSLPDDLVVCRAEPLTKEPASGNDSLIKTFTISTTSVDREGDRLLANWDLNNYNKGGSVLWGHDYRRTPEHVVAAPIATWQEGEALKSRAKFTTREVNPIGFMVHQLIEYGALRSASVGFLPKEWRIVDDDGRMGYDFEKLELLEWSVVPVPANPEALVAAKQHGVDLEPLAEWTERALDENADLVVVERDVLEATWKQVRPVVWNSADTSTSTTNTPDDHPDKGVIGYKKYPLAPKDESWNGPQQVAAAEVADLKKMCTWVDSENPDIKGSYKLPHHKADGYSTVWRGVAAAMGVLLGARGGVNLPEGDRKGVYNHLAKHYREFEEEPPEFKAIAKPQSRQRTEPVTADPPTSSWANAPSAPHGGGREPTMLGRYTQGELDDMFGRAPSMELTVDVTQATETLNHLADMVNKLDAKVADLTERLERATTSEPTPEPTRDPEDVEIDLADPKTRLAIREEISSTVENTIRELRGELPD
jgi:HK97 family phage prohead protease